MEEKENPGAPNMKGTIILDWFVLLFFQLLIYVELNLDPGTRNKIKLWVVFFLRMHVFPDLEVKVKYPLNAVS